MIEFEKIDAILQSISHIPKPLSLVVIIGQPECGENILIKCLYEKVWHYKEIDIHKFEHSSLEEITCTRSGIKIFFDKNEKFFFFQWRICEFLTDSEPVVEKFLLAYFLKYSNYLFWISAINYNDASVGHGENFKEFYERFCKNVPEIVKISVRWLAINIPKGYTSEGLLKRCKRIIPNCFSELTHLCVEDSEKSKINLFREIFSSPANTSKDLERLFITKKDINEHSAALLKFALENKKYENVAQFFLELIDSQDWLSYAYENINDSNIGVLKKLAKKLATTLMILRMKDPRDLNYQHRVVMKPKSLIEITMEERFQSIPILKEAGLMLKKYNERASYNHFDEGELLSICSELEKTPKDAAVEVLSQGLQLELINSHSKCILERKDQHQHAWFKDQFAKSLSYSESKYSLPSPLAQKTEAASLKAENAYLFLFKKMLSTFKMVKLLDPSDADLMEKVVDQFSYFEIKEWQSVDVKTILKNLCTLLSKSDITKKLEQAYLRPLLYLLDEEQSTIPNYQDMLLSHKKLVALKDLYQTILQLYNLYQSPQHVRSIPINVYVIVGWKIAQALLILADQEALLFDWLCDLLKSNTILSKTEDYLYEKVKIFETWVDYMMQLDQLMNSAAFEILKSSLEKAEENIFQVVKMMITLTNNVYQYAIGIKFDEDIDGDKDTIMSDIIECVEFSPMNASLGFTRYYSLLVVAAKYYERKKLKEQENCLSALAFSLRLLPQLSAIRSVSQLLILLEELEKTLTLPLLSAARVVLNFYQATINPEERILELKKAEKKYEEEIFSKEAQIGLRLLVSIQYLYDGIKLAQMGNWCDWQKGMSGTLQKILQPLAAIWEQHEINATVILAFHLMTAISKISMLSENEKLTIKNCFEPILEAIKRTQEKCLEQKDQGLLNTQESLVCKMLDALHYPLVIGDKLIECYNIGKAIFSTLKSLEFCKVALEGKEKGKKLAEGIQFISAAVETGDIESIKKSCQGFSDIVKMMTSQSSSLTQVVSVIEKILTSLFNIPSIINFLNFLPGLGQCALMVYCAQKIADKIAEHSGEIDNISEQMKMYAEATFNDLEKIHQEIALSNKNIKDLQHDMMLGFKDVIDHQGLILSEFKRECARIYAKLEATEDSDVLANIRNYVHEPLKISEFLEGIGRETGENRYSNSVLEMLKDLYRYMCPSVSSKGIPSSVALTSLSCNGAKLKNSNLARELLFLNHFFNTTTLPNLVYWAICCLRLNIFLDDLPLNNLSEKFYTEIKGQYLKHIDVIKVTFEILNALKGITTKDYIMVLFRNLRIEPTEDNYQKVRSLVELCGIPIYNFGEQHSAVKPWDIGKSLSENQLKQKEFLEDLIIEILGELLGSVELMSSYISYIQQLLVDLVRVGKKVFINTNFESELPLNLPLQPSSRYPGPFTLFAQPIGLQNQALDPIRVHRVLRNIL